MLSLLAQQPGSIGTWVKVNLVSGLHMSKMYLHVDRHDKDVVPFYDCFSEDKDDSDTEKAALSSVFLLH